MLLRQKKKHSAVHSVCSVNTMSMVFGEYYVYGKYGVVNLVYTVISKIWFDIGKYQFIFITV